MAWVVPFEQCSGLSDGEKLGAQITELCGYIYAATHHLLELIREFDEQQHWAELGFQSCAHWLNFKCGFGMNSARERLRVAHALGKLPKIDEAFSNGTLSFSKVRAMTRVADESVGAALAANEEPEPIAARRADALTQIAETYMNNSKNSGSTADRYQVVVHVGAERNDPHLDNGPHVTAVTSKRIACDCSRTVIQEDENGEPPNIGRRSRTIPPPMRRALKARDGGCRFLGCTNHKFVYGHHIIHWSDGGETSLENLVLLCRYHHHLVHEGGFDCKRSKDGEIWFEDGKSRRLDAFPKHNSVTLEESLAWMYRKHEQASITSESCTAKWYAGEQMDWDHAVSLMFPR